ncbi:hypothetical protein J5N97_003651 [Dioscorea zingiberensis]|uniref:Uncharacterized protein n=1 Tax=Dioscorea zingiberensis TaxID=325984 RepID=A0A9D5D4I8_9LILI|nr:hypothetical protein J5N97_003651 [Dioscorea zingiberensis]
MASAASSSSSSSHESLIPSPSNPTVSVAILGELGGVPVHENPMEDEDLSYVKGLLASFEGEVHPPLARGRKKKEVVSSQGADTSKEEKKKRKRKETDSSKKGVKSDPGAGSSRERRTKRKNSEDASVPGIAEEQAEVPQEEVRAEEVRPALSPISEGPSFSRPEDILLIEAEAVEAALLDKLRVVDSVLRGPAPQEKGVPSEDVPFRDAASVKTVLMAMRPEQLSSKLHRAGREEAISQLFHCALGGPSRQSLPRGFGKMVACSSEIAQLNSRVAALEGKNKEQLAIIHTFEKDKAERLQQLAVVGKEKDDLGAKLSISEGSLLTAEENVKKLQENSSSLEKELKSTREGQAEARWELKLKNAELAAVQAELEELKGEHDTLKEDLASQLTTPKSDSQEIKDLLKRADKLENEVARLRVKAKEGATHIYSVVQQVGRHIPPTEVLSMGLAGVLKKFTELKERQTIKTLEAYACP